MADGGFTFPWPSLGSPGDGGQEAGGRRSIFQTPRRTRGSGCCHPCPRAPAGTSTAAPGSREAEAYGKSGTKSWLLSCLTRRGASRGAPALQSRAGLSSSELETRPCTSPAAFDWNTWREAVVGKEKTWDFPTLTVRCKGGRRNTCWMLANTAVENPSAGWERGTWVCFSQRGHGAAGSPGSDSLAWGSLGGETTPPRLVAPQLPARSNNFLIL